MRRNRSRIGKSEHRRDGAGSVDADKLGGTQRNCAGQNAEREREHKKDEAKEDEQNEPPLAGDTTSGDDS